MEEYIKKFNNHNAYTAFTLTADFVKPNVSLCVNENELHYTPIQYICKLTLNDGSIMNIEGSGELTQAMVTPYKNTLVSAEVSKSCTNIGYNAFYDCSSLTSVSIGDGVTSIGRNAFTFCTSLTSVTIPDSVTSIGNNAFIACTSLASISVDSNNAVYDSRDNCNAIIETSTNTLISGCKNTVIPDSVTSIGGSAFARCSGLTSVTIPNSVTSIGDGAFSDCGSLTSITIPNSVTSIGDGAISSCTGLTSIAIPNSVTSIGNGALGGCTSLTSVTIGNSVTSIGVSAFASCYGLTSIVIPSSVTSIGSNAFNACSGLTKVTIEATTPPALGNNTFANTNNCPIYVPSASVDAYKTASGWSKYTSRIQAIPTI